MSLAGIARADTVVQIGPLSLEEDYFAIQYMCIRDYHQCTDNRIPDKLIDEETGADLNIDRRERGQKMCCRELMYCANLVIVSGNGIRDGGDDEFIDREYPNILQEYYVSECRSDSQSSSILGILQ